MVQRTARVIKDTAKGLPEARRAQNACDDDLDMEEPTTVEESMTANVTETDIYAAVALLEMSNIRRFTELLKKKKKAMKTDNTDRYMI